MSRPTIQNREYLIHYTTTLNWEDDFQCMAFDLSGWVLDLYQMIWELEPAPTATQLKRLERIDKLYHQHEEDSYVSDEAGFCFPDDSVELDELDEKLTAIQAHAQCMSVLETLRIELLVSLTSDIRCNDIGAFEETLNKWLDITRDALSASPM